MITFILYFYHDFLKLIITICDENLIGNFLKRDNFPFEFRDTTKFIQVKLARLILL